MRLFVRSVSEESASWHEFILLCATLTRLEKQCCLCSSSVTLTQHLRFILKGPGLPVSLPSHSTRPHPLHKPPTNTPSCTLINAPAINSSRQCWQSPDCARSALQTLEEHCRQTLASSHSQSALHMSHVNDIKCVATHRLRRSSGQYTEK